jgi:tRNA (uracil-5-)-methyltransferase
MSPMTTTDFSPANYQHQLSEKLARIQQDFAEFSLPEIQVFASAEKHYRMRAEFRVWHLQERSELVMFDADKKPYAVTEFPIGSLLINQLITKLLNAINSDELLRHKLYQVEFLTTQSGEALITLIYHKELKNDWIQRAEQLKQELGADIIGRSRKQKLLVTRDYVMERMQVAGREFVYQQVEASFTQPNAGVCEKMLTWAVENSKTFGGDLLELYCGNGNFTLPLSQNFSKVLATEVAKSSVDSAQLSKLRACRVRSFPKRWMACGNLIACVTSIWLNISFQRFLLTRRAPDSTLTPPALHSVLTILFISHATR